MPGLPLECAFVLAYSASLALLAFLLEWIANYTHRRSSTMSTTGFTYHSDRDVWSCPKDQHLFPVFSDSAKGRVIYRAPAAVCNACPSKAACTDSEHGREVHRNFADVESGMKRFHRAVSLTLMVLASTSITVELFRTRGSIPHLSLAVALVLFVFLIRNLAVGLVSKKESLSDLR
jgi:hypothetical protein